MRATIVPLVCFFLLMIGLRAIAGPLDIADLDEVYPLWPSWAGSRVLHIGDSHVAPGLKATLRQRFRGVGASYEPVPWIGSRSKSWVASGRLRRLIRKKRPHIVIVTLGTNIMKSSKTQHHLEWVRALVDKIGARPCYWVGPPPLLDDVYGYNALFLSAVRPCRYFDSRVLEVPRRADGKFHLSRAQAVSWADLVWDWMNAGGADEL